MKPLKSLVTYVLASLAYVGLLYVAAAYDAVLRAEIRLATLFLASALVCDLLLVYRKERTITQLLRTGVKKPYNITLLLVLLGLAWWMGGPVVAVPMIVGAVLGHTLGDF